MDTETLKEFEQTKARIGDIERALDTVMRILKSMQGDTTTMLEMVAKHGKQLEYIDENTRDLL